MFTQHMTILVADDDPQLLQLVGTRLGTRVHRRGTYASGEYSTLTSEGRD
jgi:hypothetical protein